MKFIDWLLDHGLGALLHRILDEKGHPHHDEETCIEAKRLHWEEQRLIQASPPFDYSPPDYGSEREYEPPM